MPAVFRSPRLRRIIPAYTVNRLGTWVGTVALSLAVFDHTHSALAVAGTLFAAQVLPAFAVTALVARVEASRRRRELSALYVFEAVVTAAMAVMLWHFSLPVLLLLVALDGTAALAASALLRAETARAAREQLAPARAAAGDEAEAGAGRAEQEANAALNVAFSATFVLGPVLGGAIAATAGASTALIVDAATFLVCGGLLTDLHPHVEEAGGESVRARLELAWRHITASRPLKTLLVAQAIALVFFESATPIQVAFAKTTLHAGDGGYGLLVSAWGVGVVAGSIVFARFKRASLVAMVSAGTLAIGAAYVAFSVSPSLAVAAAAAALGGIGNGIQWAPLVSLVQQLTPASLHGRVMGALESVGALSPAVGLLLGGGLVAVSSPRWAFLAVGCGAAATTLLFVRAGAAQRQEQATPARAPEVEPQALAPVEQHADARAPAHSDAA